MSDGLRAGIRNGSIVVKDVTLDGNKVRPEDATRFTAPPLSKRKAQRRKANKAARKARR